MGARVIKTGSRAYASRTGSVDLLDRLGIRLTGSYEQTEELLETFGIACAGPFVYPKELPAAGADDPALRDEDRGPVLQRDRPVPRRDPGHDPDHRRVRPLGAADVPRARRRGSQQRFWICSNDLGVDELLSITASRVYDSDRDEEFTLDPRELGLGAGIVRRAAARRRPRRHGPPLPRAARRRRSRRRRSRASG